MTVAAIRLLAQEGETTTDIPGEPWMIGVGVFVLLVALLLITLTFGKDR